MASLTHVCMWSDKGWKRITAEEAARLHPGGTVSAHSGLFMCEICGQYVLLTDSTVQVRHFRHSSAEKSKDCPERTFGTGVTYGYVADDHELPLKIQLNSNGFSFELGFIRVPESLLSKDLKISIIPSTRDAGSFAFVRERLNLAGITYLPVGNAPSEYYKLVITGTQDAIYQFWPKTVQGVDPDGSIFDAATGKKLVYDSDVEVGRKYYLLKRGSYGLHTRSRHIVIREIRAVRLSWFSWNLYEITASDYDEESARFFLDYHCRLTEEPVSIQPVWPVYIETPYLIKHGQNSVVLHIKGNAPNTQVFPAAQLRKYKCGNNIVAEIQCNSRQQLISAGRTKALQYTYFWKEPLKETTLLPMPIVLNIKGEVQEPGTMHTLPERNILRVQSTYDGSVWVENDGVIVDKRKLSAGNTVELDNLSWGTALRIVVGCDIVWRTEFIKEKPSVSNDEEIILNRLVSFKGHNRKVFHEIGGIAGKLENYPKIRQWIYKCMRDGYMNERAFRELQTWIISANKGDGGIR